MFLSRYPLFWLRFFLLFQQCNILWSCIFITGSTLHVDDFFQISFLTKNAIKPVAQVTNEGPIEFSTELSVRNNLVSQKLNFHLRYLKGSLGRLFNIPPADPNNPDPKQQSASSIQPGLLELYCRYSLLLILSDQTIFHEKMNFHHWTKNLETPFKWNH